MLQEFREFDKQMIHEKHQKVIAGLQRGELSTNMKKPALIYSGFRSMKLNRRARGTSAIPGSREVSSGDGQALQGRVNGRHIASLKIKIYSHKLFFASLNSPL